MKKKSKSYFNIHKTTYDLWRNPRKNAKPITHAQLVKMMQKNIKELFRGVKK